MPDAAILPMPAQTQVRDFIDDCFKWIRAPASVKTRELFTNIFVENFRAGCNMKADSQYTVKAKVDNDEMKIIQGVDGWNAKFMQTAFDVYLNLDYSNAILHLSGNNIECVNAAYHFAGWQIQEYGRGFVENSESESLDLPSQLDTYAKIHRVIFDATADLIQLDLGHNQCNCIWCIAAKRRYVDFSYNVGLL